MSTNNLTLSGKVVIGSIAKVFGLILLLTALFGTYSYPVVPMVLSVSLIVYAVVLFYRPLLWIAFLPIFLAAVHLSPWSGWLLFEEFDFFMLATVGVMFLKGHYASFTDVVKNKFAVAVLLALVFIYTIAFVKGFFPVQAFDANALSSYYTNYLSLRLVKSVFWVALLAPVIIHFWTRESKKVVDLLVIGVSAGLGLVGLSVLWERGVFGDILNFTDRFQLFRSFMDFSQEHRVTGMFSDMHTGGESIDGYLVLAVPFALVALLRKPSVVGYVLATLALFLGLYSVLSTFTRATYIAVIVSSLLSVGLFLFQSREKSSPTEGNGWMLLLLPVAVFVFIGALVVAFKNGGNLAVLGGGFGFLGALVVSHYFFNLKDPRFWGAVNVLFSISAYIVARALWSSKWIENSVPESWLLGGVVALLSVASGAVLENRIKGVWSFRSLIIGSVVSLAVLSIALPALLGNRMDVRFSTSSNDLDTRVNHWRNVADLVGTDFGSKLFGMGLGTYPKRYLLNIEKAGSVGTFAFGDRDGKTYLQLGGGSDLGIGQRVAAFPKEDYTVTLDINVREGEPIIDVMFCHKNLLYQTHDNPCVGKRVKEIVSGSKAYQVSFNSDFIGSRSWLERWPVVFLIYSKRVGSLVEIEKVSIRDASGEELLKNRDFADGGARWYSYNDFEHLQWHIKNFWLNIYFEMGVLGVLIFATIFLLAIRESYIKARNGNVLGYALLSALVGIQLQGMFGSMMDAPRIAFLLLLFLFVSFLQTEKIAVQSE